MLKNYGNFEANNLHLLVGNDATSFNVRSAIYDVFWPSEDPYQLIIFHFSGHGIVDGYGNGYVSCKDMIFDKPYVNGLNMTDLNRIISDYTNASTTIKKAVFMFLDCCHSGITVQGERSVTDSSVDFVRSVQAELQGDGRAVLVSSDADEKSREKKDCTDFKSNVPHSHGIFTSHLIDGFCGRAAENGVVTFDAIRSHIQSRMRKSNQNIKFAVHGDPTILDLGIAIQPEIHKDYLDHKFETIDKYQTTNLYSIVQAAEDILELSTYRDAQTRLGPVKKKIEDLIATNKNSISDILTIPNLIGSIEGIDNRVYNVIDKVDLQLSSLDMLSKCDKFRLCVLNTLWNMMQDPQNPDLDYFKQRCSACIRVHWKALNDTISLRGRVERTDNTLPTEKIVEEVIATERSEASEQINHDR